MTRQEKFKELWDKFITHRRAWVAKEPEHIRKNLEWNDTQEFTAMIASEQFFYEGYQFGWEERGNS